MLTQHENMKKADALRRINKHCADTKLNGTNTLFSNINNTQHVWWFNIPLWKITNSGQEHLHFVCYDRRSYVLHHLKIPTTYLEQHLEKPNKLRVREDREVANLEWGIEAADRFIDRASGCQFAEFHCCQMSCEHA
jgi:hypothetical protein